MSKKRNTCFTIIAIVTSFIGFILVSEATEERFLLKLIGPFPQPGYYLEDEFNRYYFAEFIAESERLKGVELIELQMEIFDADKKPLRRCVYSRNQLAGLLQVYDKHDTLVEHTTEIPARGKAIVFLPPLSLPKSFELKKIDLTLIYKGLWNNIKSLKISVEPEPFRTEVEYHLPLQGLYWLINGPDAYGAFRRDVEVGKKDKLRISSRFACNFVKLNHLFQMRKAGGMNESDYIWNESVYAPAKGLVVQVLNSVKDNLKPGIIGASATHPLGNHIVIKHGNSEYSLLAHLLYNSIAVKKNDLVRQGQYLGKVGNSGQSHLPHLRFQLMTSEDPEKSESLPLILSNFKRFYNSEEVMVNKSSLMKGDIVLVGDMPTPPPPTPTPTPKGRR